MHAFVCVGVCLSVRVHRLIRMYVHVRLFECVCVCVHTHTFTKPNTRVKDGLCFWRGICAFVVYVRPCLHFGLCLCLRVLLCMGHGQLLQKVEHEISKFWLVECVQCVSSLSLQSAEERR